MKKLFPALGVAISCSLPFATLAQAPAQPPQFDVASIRPSGPNDTYMNGLLTYPGGKIQCRGCTVRYLIMEAFNVREFQVAGGPSWIDIGSSTRYEVQAIPPGTSESSHANPAISKNPPNEEQGQMLQSLLADRFKLKVHRETKEGPVLILTRGKKTLKLEAPKNEKDYSWAGNPDGGYPQTYGLSGINISMPQLAIRISSWLRHPVLDQTGLQGSYGFEYRMNANDDDTDANQESTIITSLNEVGLNLSPGKGPVETIVIDHVEQPSSN